MYIRLTLLALALTGCGLDWDFNFPQNPPTPAQVRDCQRQGKVAVCIRDGRDRRGRPTCEEARCVYTDQLPGWLVCDDGGVCGCDDVDASQCRPVDGGVDAQVDGEVPDAG